ncbi:MAG TPA: hypothetical protein VM370_03385 [Candidatus Thermoplasmatota archaeon]|nr:hypothetical protein [Candidatus Thermoplasmatota archaeon]
MRPLPVLALLVAPFFAATAAADTTCVAAACVVEENGGDCAADGFEYHSTALVVGGVPVARGSEQCYNGGAGGFREVNVDNSVAWNEFWYDDVENGEFHQCYVNSPLAFHDAAGACPPNPGWGHLLP